MLIYNLGVGTGLLMNKIMQCLIQMDAHVCFLHCGLCLVGFVYVFVYLFFTSLGFIYVYDLMFFMFMEFDNVGMLKCCDLYYSVTSLVNK